MKGVGRAELVPGLLSLSDSRPLVGVSNGWLELKPSIKMCLKHPCALPGTPEGATRAGLTPVLPGSQSWAGLVEQLWAGTVWCAAGSPFPGFPSG